MDTIALHRGIGALLARARGTRPCRRRAERNRAELAQARRQALAKEEARLLVRNGLLISDLNEADQITLGEASSSNPNSRDSAPGLAGAELQCLTYDSRDACVT